MAIVLKKTRAAALPLLLSLAAVGCGPALQRATVEDLRRVVRREVDEGRAPSLVVAAVRGEETVAVEAAGMADIADGRAATPDTVYMLFSVTKPVTATAVMQLRERGLVDLDRPVRAYLHDLDLHNPHDRQVTVRDLLAHSSGLPNPSPFAWARPLGQRRPPLGRFLDETLGEHGRLLFEPGSGHMYSNLGYLVLGRLVEVVSGEPYEAYVRRHVLDPLGMDRTGFTYGRVMLDDAATPYVRAGSMEHRLGRLLAGPTAFGRPAGPWMAGNYYVVDGAPYGGLVGTARDLARFASMHLAGGSYRGRRVLAEESVHAMQELHRTSAGCVVPHTLGWRTGEVSGVRYFEHTGAGGGFRPALRIYPELGSGLVVLVNRTRYDLEPLTRMVVAEAGR